MPTTLVDSHRQLQVWSGPMDLTRDFALQHASTLPPGQVLWLGAKPASEKSHFIDTEGICFTHPSRARHELGREFMLVIADLSQNFDADGIAASLGMVARGGCYLILATPANWTNTRSRFQHRFFDLLTRSTSTVKPDDAGASILPPPPNSAQVRYLGAKSPEDSQRLYSQALEQQAGLVRQLANELTRLEGRVILFTADRGRGKSAALGQIAAKLCQTPDPPRVLITAPSRRATDVLFEHFRVQGQDPAPAFCPPDQLHEQAADILLVDEAAAIPLSMLRALPSRFQRIVFTSTVHGYEGGGRGFALRFAQLLRRDGIPVEQYMLNNPIRWLPDDPIEAFGHQAFLFDAPLPAAATDWQQAPADIQFALQTRERMASHEQTLREIYGLLLQAHYRTTPRDLVYLLDSEDMHTFTLSWRGQLVAAALITEEGPILDIKLRQQILRKQRRPPGNRLPQLLAQYTMQAAAMDFRCARVVRIAVHPELQMQGLGSMLLAHLQRYLASRGFQLIGAMFGALPDTVRFWQRNDFAAVHRGYRHQTSSGYPSITMARTLDSMANDLLHRAQLLHSDAERFRSPAMTTGESLPLTGSVASVEVLYDTPALLCYCQGQRSFHDCHAALSRLAQLATAVSPASYPLLRACQRADMTVRELVRIGQCDSQSDAEKQLRKEITGFLEKSPVDYHSLSVPT